MASIIKTSINLNEIPSTGAIGSVDPAGGWGNDTWGSNAWGAGI